MKKRNILFMLLMSLVTLGIYSLYWLIDTRKELIKNGAKIPSIWVLVSPFILVLAFAVLAAVLPPDTSTTYGEIILITSIILIIVAFIWIGIYWIAKYCRAVERATNKELPFGTNMALAILLWLLGCGFAWTMIVQVYFNKLRHLPHTAELNHHNSHP